MALSYSHLLVEVILLGGHCRLALLKGLLRRGDILLRAHGDGYLRKKILSVLVGSDAAALLGVVVIVRRLLQDVEVLGLTFLAGQHSTATDEPPELLEC